MGIGVFLVSVLLLISGVFLFTKARNKRRLNYIRDYEFHPVIERKVRESYPQLQDDQVAMVFEGLRDYFTFCLQSNRRAVAMPSKVVDTAWHEFIVFTRAYAEFSRKALGRFLHHTPVEAMHSPVTAQDGIKRAWRLACAREEINPRMPGKLPLLFKLDSMLDIKDGFHYSRHCTRDSVDGKATKYCAAHIACSSGCAGTSGSAGGSDCASGSAGSSGWFDCDCGGD